MSARPQFSNGGGVDSQSLETILELQNLVGTEGQTSRLDIRDLRGYNNSSSLSNFVLPQTTNRTNRTNRSFNVIGLSSCNNTLNGLSRREPELLQHSAFSANRLTTRNEL